LQLNHAVDYTQNGYALIRASLCDHALHDVGSSEESGNQFSAPGGIHWADLADF
jgi:hypothetical protein